ncbi:MAG: sigma-E processing peptidase SpoIIGA [Angelakisella sp.]|nr:sigma-E processing peptidase SpoIIGA [Angelakisella sp.]
MQTTIYADVLIAINFIIDLILLRLCVLLSGLRQRTRRRYLAAFMGAISSLLIFVPVSSLCFDLLSRAAVAMLVILIAYGIQPIRVFAKLVFIFFAVSFMLAGVVIGLWFILPPGIVAFGNGVIYFNVQPLVLIGSVIAAYGFVELFNRIFYHGKTLQEIYRITIWRGGHSIGVDALADTGNGLVEHFTGHPLVVAGFKAVAPLLTETEERYILSGSLDSGLPESLRVVAFSGVDGEGLLKAFKPDKMTVSTEMGEKEIIGYVAVTGRKIGNEHYGAVFNPRVIQILT